MEDFTLAGIPRQVPIYDEFCAACSKVSNWISAGVRQGFWRDLSDSYWNFDLGFVDEMVVTPKCALCRLVTAALSESFTELPLVYSWTGSWSIEKTMNGNNIKKEYNHVPGSEPRFWRDKVSVSVLGLQVTDKPWMQIGLSISLRSHGGPEFDLLESEGLWGPEKLFTPSIRVLAPDVPMVPAKASRNCSGRQIASSQADLKSIQIWYAKCRTMHGQRCETHRNLTGETNGDPKYIAQFPPPPRNMLVIDAQQMRIAPLPGGARYLALSYVWGTRPFLQLTKSNLEILKRKGALHEQQLPRTIEDALKLTIMLNERYLWVDALCIAQDDTLSKLEQLSQMDRVYLGAALTIISGDGKEANAGLTGFHPGSRQTKQSIETVGGVRFVVMSPPFSEVVKNQTWNSRAWTYQEYMLSKRLLVFTEQQVFYLCGAESFAEDHYRPPVHSTYEPKYTAKPTYEDTPGDIDVRHRLDNRDFRYSQNWNAYKVTVADLSSRQLTYESDVLKSIVGVLHAMKSARDEKYICGLPSSILEWALLWQPVGPMRRRAFPGSENLFPSWSWIGWVGHVKYIDHPGPEGVGILIKDWQILTYDSSPNRGAHGILAPTVAPQIKPKKSNLKGLFRNCGSEHQSPPTESSPQPTLLPYQPIVISVDPILTPTTWVGWKNSPAPQSLSNYSDRVRQHQKAMDAMEPLIESGILQFTAASAIFNVQAGPLPDGYRTFPQSTTGSFRITDRNGVWVGTVHLELKFASTFGASCEAEFIALSITHSSYEATNAINIGQNTFDTNQLRQLDQKARAPLLMNAMWIQRQDGVASRLAVGQIHVHAWERAGSMLQQVLLG
ncbi:uncharacterized protein PAC_19419 [Phialocephala subalpina]|uniref:Heterokaryon incompatibility domain-containing protein n=1 Tax=Phialocephala subalpina TaxID=576137 RepID=A0A1L7XX07_9HELO|nr:uncharacterized protein PAC_19419 [Phialocephala subalpina]